MPYVPIHDPKNTMNELMLHPAAVGDRTCMIYSGAQVVKGRARAVCVATGMKTELGKISEAMNRKETNNRKGFAAKWHRVKVFLGIAETTPLQIK